MDTSKIDPRIYALYDQYCHSSMKRREFLKRASTIAVIGGSGLAMAEALLPNYAAAQTISFTDPRIKATYETYDSPGGNSGEMRGYLVQPAGEGPFPAVLVIHENRGLNPYIEDVARRAAVAGFLAFAPDGLWPAGGYPGNDDDGKVLQAGLDRGKIHVDMLNGAKFVKSHPLSNGKLGATGFCFGGGVVNYLTVEMGTDLNAGVPFYGRQPADADVARIKAPLLAHYAEQDPRVNAGIENFKAALTENGVDHQIHIYPGTNHGFHNNSTPRYDEAAAKLAWERTTAFFTANLAG